MECEDRYSGHLHLIELAERNKKASNQFGNGRICSRGFTSFSSNTLNAHPQIGTFFEGFVVEQAIDALNSIGLEHSNQELGIPSNSESESNPQTLI